MECVLTGRVAKLHYEHGMTHQEIASELGISRIRVTRLLAEARKSGIVEITVHSEDALFSSEERALVSALDLNHAWVAPSVGEGPRSDSSVGVFGAQALQVDLTQEATVAVGVSSTVALIAQEFPDSAPAANFTPVAGSTAGLSVGANPHEIALQFASRTGGRSFHLPCPLIAATQMSAEQVLMDPGVREGLARAAEAQTLLVGVGTLGPHAGVLFEALAETAQQELMGLGAIGDICGRFFGEAGEPLPPNSIDPRVIGLRMPEIAAIPRRIVAARGPQKVKPVIAAARAGLCNELVTDSRTARAILDAL